MRGYKLMRGCQIGGKLGIQNTLTYNPLIGLYLVSKSETWTIKIFGKNAFDFAIFKIIYRGIFKKN